MHAVHTLLGPDERPYPPPTFGNFPGLWSGCSGWGPYVGTRSRVASRGGAGVADPARWKAQDARHGVPEGDAEGMAGQRPGRVLGRPSSLRAIGRPRRVDLVVGRSAEGPTGPPQSRLKRPEKGPFSIDSGTYLGGLFEAPGRVRKLPRATNVTRTPSDSGSDLGVGPSSRHTRKARDGTRRLDRLTFSTPLPSARMHGAG